MNSSWLPPLDKRNVVIARAIGPRALPQYSVDDTEKAFGESSAAAAGFGVRTGMASAIETHASHERADRRRGKTPHATCAGGAMIGLLLRFGVGPRDRQSGLIRDLRRLPQAAAVYPLGQSPIGIAECPSRSAFFTTSIVVANSAAGTERIARSCVVT